MSIADS